MLLVRKALALPRIVWIIGCISLINDTASEMIYPLVPLYLSSVLMAGPRALGLMEGLAEATASLLKLFSGVMSDRTRRCKPWIVAGYGLAGLSRPLMAFVSGWGGLLTLRLLDRIGKGLRASPRDALLADSVEPGGRGLAFGLQRAMDNAGAVLGPLLAWAVLTCGASLRQVFLYALVPALACLVLSLSLRETATPVRETPPFDWRIRDLPAVFRRYLVVVGLFSLGNASNMFLLLRARELGLSEAAVPLLWGGVSCVAMLLAVPLSALSDRCGRRPVLVGGYALYALFYILLGLTEQAGWLFPLFAAYGVVLAGTEGVEKALVADQVPAERRGTAYGWFNLVSGVFLLPASVIFGWLYQGLTPLTAFLFAGGCAGLAAALLLRWVDPKRA